MRSGAASTPGSGQGSGGFWCWYLVRFRRVPVQIPCEVPEGSGAETVWGSGGFWRRRCLVRFRRVPVQIPCEVPEGSGADALWKSKGFRCFLWHKRLIFVWHKHFLWQKRRSFQAVGDSTGVYFSNIFYCTSKKNGNIWHCTRQYPINNSTRHHFGKWQMKSEEKLVSSDSITLGKKPRASGVISWLSVNPKS